MVIRRIFSKSYKTYRQAFDDAFSRKNLIYTNILISMGISVAGDLTEQTYECYYTNEIESYDFNRTGQMGISGVTAGILCHHWYNFLDRFIVGKTFGMVLKKLFLDQFVCSPVLLLSFFATVALFEDDPIENFTDEVSQKFWILYKAEWVVWPPAQLINFYFLPTQYRVLYDSTISLGYDIYASQVKHAKLDNTKK